MSAADLNPLLETIAYAGDSTKWASTLLGALSVSINPLEIEVGVSGALAWSTDSTKLAYLSGSTLRVAVDPGLAGMTKIDVTDSAARRAALLPDGTALVYIAGDQVRTVPVAKAATPTTVPGLTGVTAVDWQPCVAATLSCYSSVPPTCSANTAQVNTQADQPVQLPAAPCTDPSSLRSRSCSSRGRTTARWPARCTRRTPAPRARTR